MAGRPTKAGLDYFELDCHMDEKIELIEAEYGLKGFAIVVKLYQSIYSGFGYYCEWEPDIALLWARRLGLSHSGVSGELGSTSEKGLLSGFQNNLINNVVAASVRRGIFSEEIFRKYHVLTSSGIQRRYLNATSKREKIELKKEYLLISIPQNNKNVVINSIYDGRNSISVGGNSQSKEEESKGKNKNNMCKADALALFEDLWKLYPLKRGKAQVSNASKQEILKIGREEMMRAIDRYNQDLEKDDWRKPQNGSTFFNSGYVDYLDKNYVKPIEKGLKKNSFHNFHERTYDYDALEAELLKGQMGGARNAEETEQI